MSDERSIAPSAVVFGSAGISFSTMQTLRACRSIVRSALQPAVAAASMLPTPICPDTQQCCCCYCFKPEYQGLCHHASCRIEDTDTARSTRESEEKMKADLAWLGLNWDEGEALGPQGSSNHVVRQTMHLRSFTAAAAAAAAAVTATM
jgi:hypothetical protein